MRNVLGFGLAAGVASLVACSSSPVDGTGAVASDMMGTGGGATSHAMSPPPGSGIVNANLTCGRSPAPGLMSAPAGTQVMAGTVNVYIIWYGIWTNIDFPRSAQQVIVTNFVQALGGSPYFDVNSQFYGANGGVTGQLVLAGSATDGGSHGTRLGPGAVGDIVSYTLAQGWLPTDPNGVYLVMAAQGVTESNGNGSFCASYCGYHSVETVGGVGVKYAFIGDPLTCPASTPCLDWCPGNPTPNGYPDADQMVSVIAHELSESVTDPLLGGWRDSGGWENADKCAWIYGNTYTTANGAQANLSLGGHDYLVQQAWINQGSGYCGMALPAAPSCFVNQACGNEGLVFACGPVQGDLVLQRQDANGITTLATVPAEPAQFQGGGVSDNPPGSGTVGYRGCANTGAGQLCSPWTTVDLPAPNCVKCPKGWVDCGGWCARNPRNC